MASYNPGTYEGTGRGYGGKLIVSVTVSENKIESVKVTQHKEYRGIAWGLNTTPMERFPKLIVEYQTLNIPTVDGADLTCAAILDATAAALKAAGASKEDIAALNRALRDSDGDIYDIIAGNFFIASLGKDDLTDLPHELAERFAEQFRQPEMFMRVDGKIVAAPMPDEQVQGGMSY